VATFEVYQDTAERWRWRLIDDNNRKVASSGESFDSRSDARRAAENVKATALAAAIPGVNQSTQARA
jgi:uncharacterized protein YegP (UPF0339 family)